MAWIMCPHCKQRIDYQWSMGRPTVCPHCRSDCGSDPIPEGSGAAIGYILLIVAAYFIGRWIWDWFAALEWYWQGLIGFVVIGAALAPVLAQIDEANNG